MSRLDALRAPLLHQRVRRIGGQSFSFLHHRFLRDGFFSMLNRDELALYLLLVLAGNRDGVCFYGYDAICTLLRCTLDDYLDARNGLIEKDLIAFDGTRFQVLSLPVGKVSFSPGPLTTPSDFENHDPATIHALALDSLSSSDDD
jgi:hypothetical protein